MKVLCAKSGIIFSVEYISAFYSSREISHPIFHLPQKKLLGIYAKWIKDMESFPETDAYLLYLALLNSTGLMEFRTPAIRTPETSAIVARNLREAEIICTRIPGIPRFSSVFASIAVTAESADLSTSHLWLGIWKQNWNDYEEGYKKEIINKRISNLETALQRLIKDWSKNPDSYAAILGKWASVAARFPTFHIQSPLTDKQCTLAEYWCEIIKCCCKQERIFKIPEKDLVELIEHVEENLTSGSIYGHALFELLRNGRKKLRAFLGMGDGDIQGTPFRILDPKVSAEEANKLALIDSAPSQFPTPEMYPSKIMYIRAKLKWDMAQEYNAGLKGLEEEQERKKQEFQKSEEAKMKTPGKPEENL